MNKLTSFEDLRALRQRLTEEATRERHRPCLVLCAGTGGQASGSNTILRLVKRYILEHKLQSRISLRITGCQGFCQMDPFIVVEPGGQLYPRLRKEDIPRRGPPRRGRRRGPALSQSRAGNSSPGLR